ncbi:MAG: hypothetical protein BGO67_01355 [Alphaproteobacteria bacterium 41-28]|nr:MAG: hypothetical protein BGO67_01355 [Alphaproteobacteria bacterium 41-28]
MVDLHGNFSPLCVILGKKCLVFRRKTLALLGRGSIGLQDPRAKKSHCFSLKKQGFSSPKSLSSRRRGMTRMGRMVNG